MLMRYPHVQIAILEELRALRLNAQNYFHVNHELASSNALPYTSAVFNETIRLFPPVPIELKECTSQSTFPDGATLPVGAIVMWIPWSMGRSKTIWGEDADSFKPERWLMKGANGNLSLMSKPAFEFPVFNGGPRSCLGKKMAESLAISVIASLIWNFEFMSPDDGGTGNIERRSQNSLTLPMEGGLPSRIKIRGKEKPATFF